DGVVHYCVANMPGAVPLASSHALNNATLSFGLALANEGLQALANDVYLRAGPNIRNGHITCKPVADSLGLPYLHALESLVSPHWKVWASRQSDRLCAERKVIWELVVAEICAN